MARVKKHPYIAVLVAASSLMALLAVGGYTASALTVTQNVLYVISDSGASVHAVYLGNGTIKADIDEVVDVKGIAASPDGKKVYVVGSKGLYIINTSTNTFVKPDIGYTNCWDVAVNPLGNEYYVSVVDASHIPYILVLNAYNDKTLMKFGMGDDGTALHLAVSPDGTKLYSCSQKSLAANFTVLDLTTRGHLSTRRTAIASDIAVKPDGSEVYVASADGENFIDTVYVFDATGSTLKYRIDTVEGPRGLVVSADGKKLYIDNNYDSTVSVFDTAARNVVRVVNLTEERPENVVLSPDGKKAYVSHSGSADGLSVMDLANYSLTSIDGVPARSNEMVICPVQEPVFIKPSIFLSIMPSLTFSPSPSPVTPTATVDPSPSMAPSPVATPTMTVEPSEPPAPCPTPKPTPGFELAVVLAGLAAAALTRKKD